MQRHNRQCESVCHKSNLLVLVFLACGNAVSVSRSHGCARRFTQETKQKANQPFEEAGSDSDGEDDSLYQELLEDAPQTGEELGSVRAVEAVGGSDEAVMDEGVSDLEYMRRRMRTGGLDEGEDDDIREEGPGKVTQ